MNQREKYMVLAGTAGVGLFLLFQLIVFPVKEKLAKTKREIRIKTAGYSEMLDLKKEYDALMEKSSLSLTGFSEREPDFTLFSFLDRLAGKAGVKDHISYMKPSTAVKNVNRVTLSLVEMKLQSVSMEQLLSYLHMVETSRNMVYVRGISISHESGGRKLLSAVLQIETVKT